MCLNGDHWGNSYFHFYAEAKKKKIKKNLCFPACMLTPSSHRFVFCQRELIQVKFC